MAGETAKQAAPVVASFIKVTPGKIMRIRTTSETRLFGAHVVPGTLADVTEEVGYELITAGKAEKAAV